ncbi:MAG: hypothetical protein PUD25_00935 [Bacilli bacterium]|nr:hypothetical protein [Bacilli bacterium]
MKIKAKLNLGFEFEVQKNSKKKKNNKKSSFLKMSMIWVVLEILSTLIGLLVTWVIDTLSSRPFYFYDRMFLFGRKVVI